MEKRRKVCLSFLFFMDIQKKRRKGRKLDKQVVLQINPRKRCIWISNVDKHIIQTHLIIGRSSYSFIVSKLVLTE